MSEMFGSKYRPAKDWAPLLNKGDEAGFNPLKSDTVPAAATPITEPAPKPKDTPIVQQTPFETLGKASRRPTILSAGQNTSPAAATYGGNKLG